MFSICNTDQDSFTHIKHVCKSAVAYTYVTCMCLSHQDQSDMYELIPT